MNFLLFAANIDDPKYREKMLIFILIFFALLIGSFIVSVALPNQRKK